MRTTAPATPRSGDNATPTELSIVLEIWNVPLISSFLILHFSRWKRLKLSYIPSLQTDTAIINDRSKFVNSAALFPSTKIEGEGTCKYAKGRLTAPSFEAALVLVKVAKWLCE
jgi:hypothetical protein